MSAWNASGDDPAQSNIMRMQREAALPLLVHLNCWDGRLRSLRGFERNRSFSPAIAFFFVELLQCFPLSARAYLPHPEYQAEDHQRDFRKHI